MNNQDLCKSLRMAKSNYFVDGVDIVHIAAARIETLDLYSRRVAVEAKRRIRRLKKLYCKACEARRHASYEREERS